MVETQFFYRLDTLQIDAVYLDCKSSSSVFKDSSTYVEVNVADPGYKVTRNHKVVLDAEGHVTGTQGSANPVQPEPVVVLLPNPGYGVIIGADLGAEKPLHVRKVYKEKTFEFWCYVTQDIKDAYQAGNLALGDVVSFVFVDHETDKPLAQQKVVKTW